MANARDIKKRIKAVGNIRRITKTMQMIATSKFAKAQLRATASKPYTEGIFDLVTQLAAKAGNISHPLIEGAPSAAKNPEVVLVITSNRGLCGPYNGSILRAAMAYLRANQNLAVEVAGKKGVGFFRFNGTPITIHTHLEDKTTYADIEKIANELMNRFITGQIRGVKLIYMKYLSTARQKPEILQLLPLKPTAVKSEAAPGSPTGAAKAASVEYEFSPPAEILLADLLPVTVRATLFQCYNDAIVSEHVARMVAMKSATDNAGKMGKYFTRKYNRARQSQITTELTEIISGAAALE
ncbi:MAG: ATP synthase F1 subunit gamma [Phycisphaerae bacterium]|nr:ATP synthase F1 subunit gamma [Phycisphaerae bacterium]